MADKSLSIERGAFRFADITQGTSSPGAGDIEVRIADLDALADPVKRLDTILALKLMIDALNSGAIVLDQPNL